MKKLAEKPFALIGIHLNYDAGDAAKVKDVMEKEKLPWRTFVDHGPIAAKWKPTGTPSFYIIDARGVIRNRWSGPPGEKAMDAALEKVIEEAEKDAKKPAK